MALLLSTPQVKVVTGPDARLVRYVRTSVPYGSILEYELLHERVGAFFDHLGRKQHVLLVDTREVMMNTDPVFEKASSRVRIQLVRDFHRVAVLVKTAIGALQVSRHIREGSLESTVFSDEVAAVAFLLDTETSPTSSVRAPRSRHSSNPRRPLKR